MVKGVDPNALSVPEDGEAVSHAPPAAVVVNGTDPPPRLEATICFVLTAELRTAEKVSAEGVTLSDGWPVAVTVNEMGMLCDGGLAFAVVRVTVLL